MTEPRGPESPEPTITRRRLLGAAAAGASALAVSGTQIGRAAAATVDPHGPRHGVPRDPARSGIEHVVVVTMENRSFDHMLSWLPGAHGHRRKPFVYKDADGVGHKTWHLDTFTGSEFHDPNHGYDGGRAEFNDGACDGWLVAPSNDIYSIGYYLQDDLAFYGQAAPYWTTCDRFFASTMGPTYPNRFYTHSAQTDRKSNTSDVAMMPTIWDSLQAAGIDGRYYYSDLPFTALWGGRLSSISSPYADFLSACAAGTLPAVSYVDPRFFTTSGGAQCDDHPHADIRNGQHFLNEIYEAVSSSPTWGTTVLVITYDEWGGFADHIPPSVAPDADPNMALRGFRIPTFVISPRARRHYVAHNTYDHTSILKMIEWRWGLPALTPRDAAARNLAEVLDFFHPADLTAPHWDVPAPSSLVPSGPTGAVTPDPADLVAGRAEHQTEMQAIMDLAATHGFFA